MFVDVVRGHWFVGRSKASVDRELTGLSDLNYRTYLTTLDLYSVYGRLLRTDLIRVLEDI